MDFFDLRVRPLDPFDKRRVMSVKSALAGELTEVPVMPDNIPTTMPFRFSKVVSILSSAHSGLVRVDCKTSDDLKVHSGAQNFILTAQDARTAYPWVPMSLSKFVKITALHRPSCMTKVHISSTLPRFGWSPTAPERKKYFEVLLSLRFFAKSLHIQDLHTSTGIHVSWD